MKRVLLLAAVALAAVPVSPASAAEGPGAAFGSASLTSVASGASFVFSTATQLPAETDLPYASSTIRLGSGSGVATVAWPGETGASLGTTVIVAGGAPQQATILNDPVIARAQSGSGPVTVTNAMVPVSTMTAHATTTDVSARATLDGASTLATTLGATSAATSVQLTGPQQAVGTGASAIRDVTIAGVVHVGSVVSTAHGSTDGAHARAAGGTVVSDLTVAGTAITVDQDGIHLAGSAVPAGPALAAVQSALQQAQVTLTLSRPTRAVTGGAVQYATGSLIVSTPAGVLSLGGVTLRIGATLDDPLTVPGPGAVSDGAGAAQPQSATTTGLPGQAALGGTVPPPTVPDAPEPVVQAILDTLAPISLTTGYGWVWVLLGAAVACTAAGALARLPGRWLPALEDPCPLEGPR